MYLFSCQIILKACYLKLQNFFYIVGCDCVCLNPVSDIIWGLWNRRKFDNILMSERKLWVSSWTSFYDLLLRKWNRMTFWKCVSCQDKDAMFGIIHLWVIRIAMYMQWLTKVDLVVQWYSYKKCVRRMHQQCNRMNG